MVGGWYYICHKCMNSVFAEKKDRDLGCVYLHERRPVWSVVHDIDGSLGLFQLDTILGRIRNWWMRKIIWGDIRGDLQDLARRCDRCKKRHYHTFEVYDMGPADMKERARREKAWRKMLKESHSL